MNNIKQLLMVNTSKFIDVTKNFPYALIVKLDISDTDFINFLNSSLIHNLKRSELRIREGVFSKVAIDIMVTFCSREDMYPKDSLYKATQEGIIYRFRTEKEQELAEKKIIKVLNKSFRKEIGIFEKAKSRLSDTVR